MRKVRARVGPLFVALVTVLVGCRENRAAEERIEKADTTSAAFKIPGDDELVEQVSCPPPVASRPATTASVLPGTRAVIQFPQPGRRHRVWIHGDLPGNQPYRFTLREMGGDTVGVEITADKPLPANHWAILTLDYSGCTSAQASRFKVGVKRGAQEVRSRAGAVDTTNGEVLGWIRGASEYILGAN